VTRPKTRSSFSRPPWPAALALLALVTLGLGAAVWAATAAPPRLQDLQRLLDSADATLQRIATLRGLQPPATLAKAIRSRDAIARRFQELMRERYPPARLEAERKALVKFALIPPDFPLEKFLLDMAAEQVAGYFDHAKGEMVLADWLPADIQAPVLTHELAHAVQDRYLHLRKFLEPTPGQSDGLLARHAILEGEATAIMIDFLVQPLGADITRLPNLSAVAAQAAGVSSAVLGQAPKFLREHLLFPYIAGTDFVVAFRRRFPWPAFTRVYSDPPRSTEQILHPEKYLGQRDDPQAVVLPDARSILGSEWSLVLEDDAGELGARSILERFLSEAEARAAAEGWGGDRYHLYERARDGRQALLFLTAWDSEADAREFAAAYARLMPIKYARANPGRGGRGLWAWTDGAEARRPGEAERDSLLVEQRGRDVLVLEGVPLGQADAVRDTVWRLRGAQR
jgi:hypothetical protein